MERDSDQLGAARAWAPFGRRTAAGPAGSFEGAADPGPASSSVRVATAEQAMACEAATIAAGTESFALMRAAGEAAAALVRTSFSTVVRESKPAYVPHQQLSAMIVLTASRALLAGWTAAHSRHAALKPFCDSLSRLI